MAMPADLLRRRRFTVREYEQMAKAGILHEDDRVELIEGEIVEMTPIGPSHAGCVNRLTRLFTSILGSQAVVSVQNPVVLGTRSEPQPDLLLLRPRSDLYADRHPRAADVLLLVEVADTSAASDRRVKLPLYARAGVAQAWLVDLTAATVEAYRLAGPGPGLYATPDRLTGDQSVPLDAFPAVTVTAAEVLG